MIPKTEVEFRANLGAVVSKSIELKNPSQKAISYDVTLEGSSDFRAKRSEVKPWQGTVLCCLFCLSYGCSTIFCLFSHY